MGKYGTPDSPLEPLKCCSPSSPSSSSSSSSSSSQLQILIMAVTKQPGGFEPSDFQTSLCDCCDDCGTCCYGMCCYVCLGCSIASDMDECCLCGMAWPIRSVYRTRYNINGSMCSDAIAGMCCLLCVTCQLKRDIDRRKEQGIF